MVLDSSWLNITENYGHRGVTAIHVTAFITGIFNFWLNGLIWWAFHFNPRLLSKSNLHLFYAFAVTNSLTGLATVPTYLNLFIHNNLNCPRWSILIGSTFEIALEKMRAILTLGIALERIHAIYKPGEHYFRDHGKFAKRVCIFSVVLGLFDSVFLVIEDRIFMIRVHCVTTAASGPLFHWYFLISIISAGLLLTVFYIILICRLFVIKGYHAPLNRSVNKQAAEAYRQVNSLTVVVILIVLLFSVLPSSLYLHDMIIGQVIFMQWGPIVTVGYHIYGICSFFLYNMQHHDINMAFRQEFPRFFKILRFHSPIPSVSQPSIIPKPSTGAIAIKVSPNITEGDEIHL